MPFAFKFLRAAFVWVLMTMTVASGFPQMHCRCGEAKGQRLGDCCLSKSADQDGKQPCCCAHAATAEQKRREKDVPCSTCHHLQSPRAAGCCYWRDGAPRVPSKPIPVPELTAPMLDIAWKAPHVAVPNVAQVTGVELPDDPLPPPDRVILFQHWLV